MTVFKYSLRRGLMKPLSILINCILPIGILIVDYFTPGYAYDMSTGRGFFTLAILILFGAFTMAGGIQADRLDGVTLRILAGPVTFRSYLTQNFFAGLVPMMVLTVIIGTLGVTLHGWTYSFAAAVMLVYNLLAATSVGLSFVWSIWFKDKETSYISFTFVLMLMGFVGGVMLPLSIMPPIVRNIGSVIPIQWAVRGLEELLINGITTYYWLCMLALTLFAVVLLLYGSRRRIV
jgi:ABC-2 type transport system permease protein